MKNDIDTSTSNIYSSDLIIYDAAIRQYPPNLYDTSTAEATATGELTYILPTTFYKGTFTINFYTNGYGIGTYNVYTSSYFNSGAERK